MGEYADWKNYVDEYLPYSNYLAKKLYKKVEAYISRTLLLQDFEQEAASGLLYAARRFDPDRNVAFRTYAYRRIQGALIDALRRYETERKLMQRIRSGNEQAWLFYITGEDESPDSRSIILERRALNEYDTEMAFQRLETAKRSHALLMKILARARGSSINPVWKSAFLKRYIKKGTKVKTLKEIAGELGVSETSVNIYINKVWAHLGFQKNEVRGYQRALLQDVLQECREAVLEITGEELPLPDQYE